MVDLATEQWRVGLAETCSVSVKRGRRLLVKKCDVRFRCAGPVGVMTDVSGPGAWREKTEDGVLNRDGDFSNHNHRRCSRRDGCPCGTRYAITEPRALLGVGIETRGKAF